MMSEVLKLAQFIDETKVLPVSTRLLDRKAHSDDLPLQEELSSSMQEEIQNIKDSAAKLGYKDGYDAGVTKATAEHSERSSRLTNSVTERIEVLNCSISSLNKVIKALNEKYEKVFEQIEPTASAIAFAAVCEILGSYERHEQTLRLAITNAMKSFSDESSVIIYLSKFDADLLNSTSEIGEFTGQIRVDENMIPGDCIIEAGPRSLNASLLTQLDSLRQLLIEIQRA